MEKNHLSIRHIRKICYPKTVLDQDPWYAKLLFRKFGIYLIPIFIKLNISANQVSIIGFMITILGSIFLIFGEPTYWLIASLLFYLYLLLDHVDGGLARYYKTSSAKGHYIDGLLDFSGQIIIIASMFIGLYNKAQEVTILFIGFFALICTAIYFITKMYKSRVIELNNLLPVRKNKMMDKNEKSVFNYFAIPFTHLFWILNIIILTSVLDMLFETGVLFRFIYLIFYTIATFFGVLIMFRQSINELKSLK